MISFIVFLVSCVAYAVGSHQYTMAAQKAHKAGDLKLESRLLTELGGFTLLWFGLFIYFVIRSAS